MMKSASRTIHKKYRFYLVSIGIMHLHIKMRLKHHSAIIVRYIVFNPYVCSLTPLSRHVKWHNEHHNHQKYPNHVNFQ